jgi:hypothetical protein
MIATFTPVKTRTRQDFAASFKRGEIDSEISESSLTYIRQVITETVFQQPSEIDKRLCDDDR